MVLVGDHQVEAPGVGAEDLQRLQARGLAHYIIAQPLQKLAAHADHGDLVVDQQDAALAWGQGCGGQRFGHLALPGRQHDLEGAAPARFAVERDVAAVILDDALDHGQAEPGTVALGLGGEKGLQDALPGLGVHAGAAVAHHNAQKIAGLQDHALEGQFQHPAGRGHGLGGVGAKVHQHLMDLAGIGQHQPLPGRQRGHLDVDGGG